MIETVKFNVGGQLHQVSRSLLEMYPNTLLHKLVSELWCVPAGNGDGDGDVTDEIKTNNSDDTVPTSGKTVTEDKPNIDGNNDDVDDVIFIDRDGQLFRHILNYLRDSRVVLPVSIDMNTFIHELSYYGIQLNEDNYSSVTVNTQANAQSVLQINGLIASLEKEECCIRFARFCITQFKHKGNNLSSSNQEFLFVVRGTDYGEEQNKKKEEGLYNAVEEVSCGGVEMKERTNVYLKRFGLSLKRIDAKDVYRQRTKYNIFLEVL